MRNSETHSINHKKSDFIFQMQRGKMTDIENQLVHFLRSDSTKIRGIEEVSNISRSDR